MTDDIQRDAQTDVHGLATSETETVTATCDTCNDEIELSLAEVNLAKPLYCGECQP